MSNISKYYQVTNFILLEYKTDQYAAINGMSTPETDRVDLYMFRTSTGEQQCLDMSNIKYTSYPEDTKNDIYFPGFINDNNYKKPVISDLNISFRDSYKTDENGNRLDPYTVGTIILDSEGHKKRVSSCLRDTVRLYFATGYFMNSLQALSLKVEAPVKTAKLQDDVSDIQNNIKPLQYLRIKENITLLQYYLPKSKLFGECKRLQSPLYFNSRFYDRYIEITLPSGYDLAVNAGLRNIDYVKQIEWTNPYTKEERILTYRGFIDKNSPGLITFSTVSDDFVTYYNERQNEVSYLCDSPTKIPITYESNAKYFNVELYEDEETGTVVYQPVYGEPALGQKMQPFDLQMMNKIESNIIHIYDTADVDSANDGIDDFIELYGEDAYKWCIINELSVSYYYDYITESDKKDAPKIEPYTEYYTNTIDYTGKNSAHGEFWKSKFLPYIQERPLMTCNKIGIVYTAHLYNRMNNREITRTASMIVNNPMKYNRTIINPGNIYTYKVINKIVQNTSIPNNITVNPTTNVEKYVPNKYVSVMQLGIKMSGDDSLYKQNTGVLKLFKGPQQYMFQFFELNDNGGMSTIPHDLNEIGTIYKLVFPLATKGDKLEYTAINTQESGTELMMGRLMFFISGDDAERILGFTGDHLFQIIAYTTRSTVKEVTLYTGSVKWSYT